MSGRSDQGFGTPTSATTLLLREQACSDRCFGTSASATTLLLRGQARSDRVTAFVGGEGKSGGGKTRGTCKTSET